MSLAPDHDSYRNTHDGKAETESHTSYSIYFLYDNANVAPINPYIDTFGGIYTSPTFTKARNYNPYPPSNTFPTGAAEATLDSQFEGAIYSPPTPRHCVSVPFATSSNGADSALRNEWQVEADSLMQTSPGMQWWRAPVLSASNPHSAPSSRILEPSNSNTHSHNAEFRSHSNSAADESQHQNHADSLQLGSLRKRKKGATAASCQETTSMGNITGRRIAPACTTELSKTPMALASDHTDANTNPSPPESSRKAGPKNGTHQIITSSPATSRSDQRARNKTAAIKCRTKTKAAVAKLEATEKAESSRHEALLRTLRGLQEDVFALKSEILLHGNCADGLIQDYLNSTARSLATG